MTPDTKSQARSASKTLGIVGAALVAGVVALNLIVPAPKPRTVTVAWDLNATWTEFWITNSRALVWSSTNLAAWSLKTNLPAWQTNVVFDQIPIYATTNIERGTNRRTGLVTVKTNVSFGSQEFFRVELTNMAGRFGATTGKSKL